MTVVLVCGGRTFAHSGKDAEMEKEYFLNRMQMMWEKRKPHLIVHGNAYGPDKLSGDFALNKEANVMVVPAKWNQFGKAAGMKCNAEMLALQNVDLVVAFPGGVGTKGMIKLAKEANIDVTDLTEDYKKWSETNKC